MRKLVHLDDDPVVLMRTRLALSKLPPERAVQYMSSSTIDGFWSAYSENIFCDCILLDMVIGDDTRAGANVLKELRKRNYAGPVIMMSSLEDAAGINLCVEYGASDFITKGAEEAELILRIDQSTVAFKKISYSARDALSQFAGETMRQVYLKMPRILDSTVRSVLVSGESGTGKEVVAHCLKETLENYIPFVTVNCAALNKDLLESELFGHEKGAFTGAQTHKQGLFSVADGGWIFLDEVARLSAPCQAALLRTLENGEIRPVGSSHTKKVNVRILAATNEDLEAMVEKGEFRGDLLQRLKAYEIDLPPLRERRDELGEILDALLDRLNKQSSKSYRLAPSVRSLFLSHDWKKGNVRELWQVLQAASVDAEQGLITIGCLPRSFSVSTEASQNHENVFHTQLTFPMSYTELEEKFFLDVLINLKKTTPQLAQSQRKLAETLGITRHTLCVKLEKLDARNLLPSWIKEILSASKNHQNEF